VGTHLVALVQYIEHDHHISHLNPIKNIFQNSFLYLKNHKNQKIKKHLPMLPHAVVDGNARSGSPQKSNLAKG